MLEDAVVILGFIGAAVFVYFMIGKIYKVAKPEDFSAVSKPCPEHRIVTEDTGFLQEIRRYIDPVTCRFYSGRREDILEDMKKNPPELAVLYENPGNPEFPQMSHERLQYYVSALESEENGLPVYPLHYHPRKIDIYYKKEMDDMITRMKEQGVMMETSAASRHES